MILAERDETGAFTAAADGVLEKRRYYGQNWRSDTAMVATDLGKLVENVKYLSNGVGKRYHVADTDGDGDWDATDAAAITGAYDVLKDADMDGDVDANDITQANAFGGYTSTPLGTISIVENRKGYAGYELEPNLTGSKFHVRNRVLDGELGRWSRRDPLGYVDGQNLYAYAGAGPVEGTDPFGHFAAMWANAVWHTLSGFPSTQALHVSAYDYYGWISCKPRDPVWVIQQISYSGTTSNCTGGGIKYYSVLNQPGNMFGTFWETPGPIASGMPWFGGRYYTTFDRQEFTWHGGNKTGSPMALGGIAVSGWAYLFCESEFYGLTAHLPWNWWEKTNRHHDAPWSTVLRPPWFPQVINLPPTRQVWIAGDGCGSPSIPYAGFLFSSITPSPTSSPGHIRIDDPW